MGEGESEAISGRMGVSLVAILAYAVPRGAARTGPRIGVRGAG